MSAATPGFTGTLFKKSTVIFAQGDLCSGVWILVRGRVALAMSSRTGKQFTISYAEPRTILGLADVLANDGVYLANAVAATNVTAHYIAKADVLGMLRDDPVTSLELIQTLCADLSTVYDRLRCLKSVVCGEH